MDKKRGLGALALVFAGSILGRETVVWAWNKALDAIAGLFTGESPKVTVSTAFPWLDALGLVMGLVGIGFLISGYRSKRTRDAAQPLHPFDEAGFVKSLYLVRTTVEGPNTLAELYLRIGLLLFNATGDVVFVNMAEGAIAAFEGTGGKRRDLGILPPPRLEDAVQIPPLTEHYIMLEQRLPRDVADTIDQTLSKLNEVVEFDLSGLNVFCAPANVDKKVRLPLWEKITVKRTTDVFFVGRIIEARAHATLLASVTL